MFTESNFQTVLIGKEVNKAALTATPNPTDAAVVDGEILVMGYNGATKKEEVIITATGCTIGKYPKIRLVQKVGSGTTADYIYSPWIDGRYVSQFRGSSYTAGQEQIHVIGYNGTSGSVDVTAGLDFITRIQYKHEKANWAEQVHIRPYVYPLPVGTPVQSLICADLMKQVNNDPATMVSAEMLNSAAGTAIGAAADTIVGSIGSKSLVVTDTGADSSVIALAAGDFIRVGTATTAAVYKIAAGSSLAVTGGTVLLESPLQAAVNLIGTTCEYITAAQAAAANSGVKFTGLANVWALDTFPFVKTRFTIGLYGFGSTTLTETQEAKTGNGVYELVAEHEWQAKGNRGALNRNVFPFPLVNTQVSSASGSTYDCVTISASNVKADTIEGMRAAPFQVYMYLLDGTDQWLNGDTNNPSLESVIEAWMVSVPNQFPGITL